MIKQDMTEEIEFVEILQTTDPTELEIINGILRNADIRYYFKGHVLGRIFPTMNKPARLMVEKEKCAEAKELLKGHGTK